MPKKPPSLPSSVASATSPLALFDDHEMSDSIQRTINSTDKEIANDIVAQHMCGKDFLRLDKTALQTLSKNNVHIFRELRKLQKFTFGDIPSLDVRSYPGHDRRLQSIFTLSIINHRLFDTPEAFSGEANYTSIADDVIDNHNGSGSDSSAIFGAQVPEHEAFDDAIELTPDIHATAAEVAIPQDDPTLPDHSLQPDAPEHPTLGPLPSTSTSDQADISEADALISGNAGPQNNLMSDLSSFPITCTHTPASDDTAHVNSAEETPNAEFQSQDEPINADEASILEESQSVNSLGSDLGGGLDGDNTHLNNHVHAPDVPTSSTRSSSPTLSYVDADDTDPTAQLSQIPVDSDDTIPIPHITPVPPEQDSRSSMISSPVTATSSQLTPDSLAGSQLEHALEPPHLPPNDLPATTSAPLPSLECSLLCLPPFLESSVPDLKLNPISDACLDANKVEGQTDETPNISNTSADDIIHKVDSPGCSNTSSEDLHDSSTWNGNQSTESYELIPLPSPSSSTSSLDSEPDEGLSHSVNIQSVTSSSAPEILKDSDSEVSSTHSPSRSSAPETYHDLDEDEDKASQSDLRSLPDTDDEPSNVDVNTFTLPIDIIPVTPPGSPILEGLYQYMVFDDLEASGGVLRVGQDNASTPVQQDIAIGSPPPSGNGHSSNDSSQHASNLPESPETNGDIPIQTNLPCPTHLSHVQVRDSFLGMSTSPFERIQTNLSRVLIPALFALDRETIDGTTTTCSATSSRIS